MRPLLHATDVAAPADTDTTSRTASIYRSKLRLRGEAASTLAAFASGENAEREARKRARFEEESSARLERTAKLLRLPSASSDYNACTFRPISTTPPPTIEPPPTYSPRAIRPGDVVAEETTPPVKAPTPPMKELAPPSLGRSPSIMAAAAALVDAACSGTRRRLKIVPDAEQPSHVPLVSSASGKQLQQLAAAFLLRPQPTLEEMTRLSRHVGLPRPTLAQWYERRRALQEWVRQQSSSLPPAEIAERLRAEAAQ